MTPSRSRRSSNGHEGQGKDTESETKGFGDASRAFARSGLLLVLAACSAPPAKPLIADLDLDQPHATRVVVDGGASVPDAAPIAATPPATATDFIADAQQLYKTAACAERTSAHCGALGKRIDEFRAAYFKQHRAWFAANVPATIPQTVVYPFGGGDLLSALVAFPDATEVTTISLELAGDPRRIRTLAPGPLAHSLGALRGQIGGLVTVGSNTSANLSDQQQNELPGQVSSFLIGLVAGDYEPVALRYFTLADDGGLRYVTDADLAAEPTATTSLDGKWLDPNFSALFANSELVYRKRGETQLRTHRHIAWNLENAYLAQHPQLLAHLKAKGQVTVLVKGASYLLWTGAFSTIRTYLTDHLAWMLSDSTGIPPAIARRAGLQQTPFGAFTGAFLGFVQNSAHDADMVELWARSPRRRLGFRFGYPDRDKHGHLLITTRSP